MDAMNDNRPYTTEALATRWAVSQQHIRDMIRAGTLRSFRVGRLIRIPAIAVTGAGLMFLAYRRVGTSVFRHSSRAVSPFGVKYLLTLGCGLALLFSGMLLAAMAL